MLIIKSLKTAVATLRANKVRSGLTMLGIIIGNASVVAMIRYWPRGANLSQ
jgi:putative ABC transport system permease protein